MSDHAVEQIGGTDKSHAYINDVARKFLADLEEEKSRLPEEFPILAMLAHEAFERVCSTGRIPGKENMADVYHQRPIRVTQKVFIPVKEFPKFNFAGKILGPKGNSLRRLHEETQCRITIKGRGSMRDRAREEELRNSGDPVHSHLNKNLYLEISTLATPAEAHARIAYALSEIRKYLVPDKNDEVSNEQLRELIEIDPEMAKRKSQNDMIRSVFEKKMGGDKNLDALKLLNLIKHTEEEEEEEEVHRPYGKFGRPSYEYVEADGRSASGYKRASSSVPYGTEFKRVREGTVRTPSYKSPMSILKKYTG